MVVLIQGLELPPGAEREKETYPPLSPLCPCVLVLHCCLLLAKPGGKCGSLQSREGMDLRKPAGDQHCGLLMCGGLVLGAALGVDAHLIKEGLRAISQ